MPNSAISDPDSAKEILSVSELNSQTKGLLEKEFSRVWVEGEISNLSKPGSGHWYFTLKDEQAQIQCAMFRNRNQLLRFRPENGMQVILRGRVSLYEARGNYQLIADNLTLAGEGQLQQRFEALKNKLSAEGLFDSSYKKELPALPKHIGVITSPSGAAIHDILTVLKRRFPAIPITLFPVAVQGNEASEQIVGALEKAQVLNEQCHTSNSPFIDPIDVIILGRGGGSLEDLWPFNEEAMARTIFDSDIPIVSAVGHEVDFSISDFVADARAPTPSAAAEMLSPDQTEWQSWLAGFEYAFSENIKNRLEQSNEKVANCGKRLKHPGRRIEEHNQRLDELEQRLSLSRRNLMELKQAELKQLTAELYLQQPSKTIQAMRAECSSFVKQLEHQISTKHAEAGHQFELAANKLNTLNPLNTLARGYTITENEAGTVISDASEIKTGETIKSRLAKGHLVSEVLEVNTGD